VYPWSLTAHDALRKVTTNHVRQKSEENRTEPEIPALSPQVRAHLRNHLDPEIAGYAKRASQELSKAQGFPIGSDLEYVLRSHQEAAGALRSLTEGYSGG